MNNINFYDVILIISVVLVISNIKSMVVLKKQKLTTLYTVKDDNKGIRTLGLIFFAIMTVSIILIIIDAVNRKGLTSNEITQIVAVGLLFIGVYIPLIRKTKLTDKGIIKNGSLIKWADIKFIEYPKQNKDKDKGKVKVKVNYNTKYNKPISVEIVFKEDNEDLTKFKEITKQYRKKGKKSKIQNK